MHAVDRPNVLAVNDDPSQLRLCAAILEKVGIHVTPCLSAEEALRLLGTGKRVDTIITDLHMPGIDGWHFCRLLRSPEYAAFHETPILVVSATFTGVDAARLTDEIGANGFLASPYAPSALQEHVRALLDGKKPPPSTRILLVAADAAAADPFAAELRRRGCNVELAYDEAEARHLLAAQPTDVLLIIERAGDTKRVTLLEDATTAESLALSVLLSESADAATGEPARRADTIVRGRVSPSELADLCERLSRQRSLMRIEEMLQQRTRALRDSEERWRSLLEGVPEAVLVYDRDGLVLHANRVAAQRLGAAAPDLVGRNVAEFEHQRRARPRARGAGDEPVVFETTYLTERGDRLDVEVSEQDIQFGGKPATLAVARDFSVRRELDRQKANFLGMLTHDIKNPLAVIVGFAAMLPELGPLNDEQQELLLRVKGNAQTVLSLVANYLVLAEIETGGPRLLKRPVSLNEILQRVCEQFGSEAELRRIDLVRKVDPGATEFRADEVAIERVLSNLLHNALKFTPAGGRIAVESTPRTGAVAVSVTDTGGGIDPDRLPDLFAPYGRGAERRPKEGARLGLFVAQNLVQAHGGTIEVDSTPGNGTRVTFTLPAP